MILRNFFFWLSTKKSVTAAIARHGMRYGFAQRFVAGETLDEALVAAGELCRSGRRVILNLLGENVETPDDARRACDTYIEMLAAIERAGLDANISIKLTQLGLDFDQELCLSLAQEIAGAALRMQRTIEIDMESSPYVSRTLDIFEQVHTRNGNAGVAVQAYLRRSEADIESLGRLALGDRGVSSTLDAASAKNSAGEGRLSRARVGGVPEKNRGGRELPKAARSPAGAGWAKWPAAFFHRDCDARSAAGAACERSNCAVFTSAGCLRIPDDLWNPAGFTAASIRARAPSAGIRAVRHGVVSLLHAQACRTPCEPVVRAAQPFRGAP